MPTFSSAQVTDPFLSQNELLAPMLAHIAAQEKLGNLDINRRELALKENKFAQGLSLGDEFAKSITGDGTTGASIPGDSTPFERKMGFSEGGGTADKVNSEGYAGQYQFGAARLADLGLYTPAQGEDLKRNEWKGTFKIAPYGVANLQDFLKNPAAQHAAFVAHVADVDKVIDATPGADKFDRNGLRAVAHLGGNGGMQAFVASGGNLNRADSNGTSLKAYYQKFADGGAPLLQKAFGAPHGPGGPQSNLPTVQPGRLAGWVDPNAPLPVPPIPPAGGPPPAFNPNTGPRVAGASPAGAPGVVSAVTPQAAPGITPPRAVGDDPNGPAPTPTVTGQADETAPVVAQTKTAMRLGGTDVAGPPGVVPAPPEAQPNRMAYGTGLPGVTIGLPTNGLAPPQQATAPVVTAAAPPAQAQPQQPPPAPSRVISREPLIQSGMARGLTRDQALNAARLFKSGAEPAAVLQHIDQLRHQNDVIRQGDATQAAIDEKENYARQQAATKATEDRADKDKAAKLAEATSAREAAKAHDEILNRIALKKKAGTATPEEEQLYAGSYYAKQQEGATATTMDGPDGQKIPVLITRRLPKQYPEPEGGALPLVVKSPDAPTKASTTEYQNKAGGYADRMQIAAPIMNQLDDASTYTQRGLERAGKYVGYSVNSPEYEQLRTAQKAFLGAILKKESGATISETEFVRDGAVYFPQPGESVETARLKQRFRQAAMEATIREAGEGYKPASSVAAPQIAPKVIKFDATGKRVSE